MGGATMFCIICGYPADSRYAQANSYVEDISHLDDIVVFLKDGSFSGVGRTDANGGYGWVDFPDGTHIRTIDIGGEDIDRGLMMHNECSLVLREMMGSNGISVSKWLCVNENGYNNTINGYCYDEYEYSFREDQYWYDYFSDDDEDDEEAEYYKEKLHERKTVNMALVYASPNIDGFVYDKSVINTVSDEQPSVLNLIFNLMMFDMFIDYKDVIALAGTSKLMRGQIARDNRYWKRVHNYRKLNLDKEINFDQLVQKLHSPNVMKRSRLQYTVQYILDRCTA